MSLLSQFSSIITAQTLHALIFVNEKEVGREVDRQQDLNNMYSFWKEIASTLGYTFNYSINSDTKFTSTRANALIANLNVNNNDIVVFYYSGHGHNDETNIWPSLAFKDKSYGEMNIMKAIKKVNSRAKLTLCIADCCNKQARYRSNISNSYASSPNAIKKLFTGFKGKKSIIMSASKQGQFSWSDLRYGAYFGISLRQAIYNVSYESATWDKVLDNARNLTYKYSENKQTPQFNISQSGDPFE